VALSLSASGVGTAFASERGDYDQAWQFFQQGRYTEAIGGFKSYLSKYPKGSLAAEARFTLARIEPSGNNATTPSSTTSSYWTTIPAIPWPRRPHTPPPNTIRT